MSDIRQEVTDLFNKTQQKKQAKIKVFNNINKPENATVLQNASNYGVGMNQLVMNNYKKNKTEKFAPSEQILTEAFNVPTILVQTQLSVMYEKLGNMKMKDEIMDEDRTPRLAKLIEKTAKQLNVEPFVLNPAKILGIPY